MATSRDETLARLKREARDTWRAGDYDAVAEGIWMVGERVVARVGIREGDRLLDVACGSGNAAVQAAAAGARVTALDITPELFDAGRRRADEAGVRVEWVQGDAEDLPFDDHSFDVVLSTFGVMFAPRHIVAAREMARVLRPGGRMGLSTWTPDGTVADMFRALADELTPPPAIVDPPLLWGSPEHVEKLFDGTGVHLSFERDELPIDPEIDAAEATEFYVASFGPLIKAKELLEPQGRWRSLLDRLQPVLERMVRVPASYLIIRGKKADDG